MSDTKEYCAGLECVEYATGRYSITGKDIVTGEIVDYDYVPLCDRCARIAEEYRGAIWIYKGHPFTDPKPQYSEYDLLRYRLRELFYAIWDALGLKR